MSHYQQHFSFYLQRVQKVSEKLTLCLHDKRLIKKLPQGQNGLGNRKHGKHITLLPNWEPKIGAWTHGVFTKKCQLTFVNTVTLQMW